MVLPTHSPTMRASGVGTCHDAGPRARLPPCSGARCCAADHVLPEQEAWQSSTPQVCCHPGPLGRSCCPLLRLPRCDSWRVLGHRCCGRSHPPPVLSPPVTARSGKRLKWPSRAVRRRPDWRCCRPRGRTRGPAASRARPPACARNKWNRHAFDAAERDFLRIDGMRRSVGGEGGEGERGEGLSLPRSCSRHILSSVAVQPPSHCQSAHPSPAIASAACDTLRAREQNPFVALHAAVTSSSGAKAVQSADIMINGFESDRLCEPGDGIASK